MDVLETGKSGFLNCLYLYEKGFNFTSRFDESLLHGYRFQFLVYLFTHSYQFSYHTENESTSFYHFQFKASSYSTFLITSNRE